MGRLPPRDAGAWAEDGGERPRRSRAWRSRVGETSSGLAVGHSGYAQPPASVLPALSAPPSRVPYTRRALRAAQRSSPPRVGGLPRCSPARSWHKGRRAPTTAQTAATSRPASPLRCAPCARVRSVSDLGAAACGEAELTKRSAASQLATASTRSLQPPPCPLSERRRTGRPTHLFVSLFMNVLAARRKTLLPIEKGTDPTLSH